MNIHNEHIDLLIFKYLDKSASEQESAELLDWVKAQDQNKRYFQAVSKQFVAMSGNTIDFDADKAWNAPKSSNNNKQAALKNKIIIFSIALGLVGAGVAWWLYQSEPKEDIVIEQSINETYQSTDSLKDIVLADGVKITLDKNSALTITKQNGLQVLSIKGRGLLQIPDNMLNYAIKTPDGSCKLKKGLFQIEQVKDSSPVQVKVVEGAATLLSDKTDTPVELLKNNAVAVQKGKTVQHDTMRNANYLAWKTGVLEFDNTPLSEAIVLIAEYYKKNITIETPGLERCLLNAKLDRYSFDEVKMMFEIAFNAKFREEGDTVYISGTPCK